MELMYVAVDARKAVHALESGGLHWRCPQQAVG